jgi:hypothetical protein
MRRGGGFGCRNSSTRLFAAKLRCVCAINAWVSRSSVSNCFVRAGSAGAFVVGWVTAAVLACAAAKRVCTCAGSKPVHFEMSATHLGELHARANSRTCCGRLPQRAAMSSARLMSCLRRTEETRAATCAPACRSMGRAIVGRLQSAPWKSVGRCARRASRRSASCRCTTPTPLPPGVAVGLVFVLDEP